MAARVPLSPLAAPAVIGAAQLDRLVYVAVAGVVD
jgi:hypothetical protein